MRFFDVFCCSFGILLSLQLNVAESITTTDADSPISTITPESSSSLSRTSPDFRVSYVGLFRSVLSEGCTSAPPTLVIACQGHVEITNTSDPSIVCGSESLDLSYGRNAVLCENTCVGNDCSDIYVAAAADPFQNNGTNDSTTTTGEIYFECHGTTWADTVATFVMTASTPGICDGSDPLRQGTNLKQAQLGVQCPHDDNGGSMYQMDGNYTQCGEDNKVLRDADGMITCETGNECGNSTCQVQFDEVVVGAKGVEKCIYSINGSPVPKPGVTYSASYVGRFQQVLSPGCTGSPPAVVLVCGGSVDITGTSDPSISCRSETVQLGDGRSAKLCENICIDGVCDYLTAENLSGENPFGEVYFECRGRWVEDVDAAVIIPRNEPGVCDGSNPDGDSVNAYLAQLGIECNGTSPFIIDDLHSECGVDNKPLALADGLYTCSTGGSCSADASCQVTFEQLVVNADPHRFQKCLESSDGSEVPEYPSQEGKYREYGVYSSTFRARWSFLIDDDECRGSTSPKTIICTNGPIKPITPLVEGGPCRLVFNDTLEGSIECFNNATVGSFDYVSLPLRTLRVNVICWFWH